MNKRCQSPLSGKRRDRPVSLFWRSFANQADAWMVRCWTIWAFTALFICAIISPAQAIIQISPDNLQSVRYKSPELTNIGCPSDIIVVNPRSTSNQSIAEFGSVPAIEHIKIFRFSKKEGAQGLCFEHISSPVGNDDSGKRHFAMWSKISD